MKQSPITHPRVMPSPKAWALAVGAVTRAL
jgi:hypothetical protein